MRWDPLIMDGFDPGFLLSSKKQTIKNILKSYVGFFDPFCELIQNAMDAVDLRANYENDKYVKSLSIIVNLQENSIYVADNGIGFDEQKFKAFLSPNITFKTSQKLRGNKGVGATYLGYGFNHLEMFTKTRDFSCHALFKNARTWIESDSFEAKAPEVESIDPETSFEYDQGSYFKIILGGSGSRPSNVGWIGATTAIQWKYILLTKTPLGHVVSREEQPPIYFSLRVIDESGDETSEIDQVAKYYYPHRFFKDGVVDISEILDHQRRRMERGQDTSVLPSKFRNLTGIYSYYANDELIEMAKSSPRVFNADDLEVIQYHNITAYGFFGYTADLFTKIINEEIIKTRRGQRIVKSGLFLATDNMIQGESTIIPLTSNIGHQNQSQVVIHLDNAEPDLGRKGFQPEILSVSQKLSVSIVSNRLSKWRHILRVNTGAPVRIIEESNIHKWILDQQNHEKDNPIQINNDSFFLPTKRISITSEPICEQDVIVLFNQLLAGGVIRSIKLMSTSQYKQYDGLFKCVISDPLEFHYYSKDINPLGVNEPYQYEANYESMPYVLEYKYSLDALIEEFETEDKNPNDIKLAVVWDIGRKWKEEFNVVSYLLSENRQNRDFHGLTHGVYDSSNRFSFWCIGLKELVLYLNDAEKYSVDYSNIYSDEYQ